MDGQPACEKHGGISFRGKRSKHDNQRSSPEFIARPLLDRASLDEAVTSAAQKKTKKSSSISFDHPDFCVFDEHFASDLEREVRCMGESLKVLPDQMSLWLSLNRFALGVAVRNSGLPEDRFPTSARDRLAGGMVPLDDYGQHCLNNQDKLHAPARKRAQEAIALWNWLRDCVGDTMNNLWLATLFLFLQYMNVYVGEADFLERFVLDDTFFHNSILAAMECYVKEGDPLLHTIVHERLMFWALSLRELNVFFNPRDGRRQTDTRKRPIQEEDEDRDELQEELFDAADAGPCDAPAPDTDETACSGCPRIACRSRWMDTLIAMQDTWWKCAEEAASSVVSEP